MLAPPPRLWPAPPPAHVNGTSAATRYGYSSLAQILPSPQDKGDEQTPQTVVQQHPGTPLFAEEPVKLRKETKHICTANEWRRKDRGRVKIEPGLTPCQVQEVTTSSKHEQNGGIPVGIAVARQRVQQSTPPPLTVLTCEERSTNHVTGWTGPPPHWHYPAGLDQNLPLQVPPLQLGRDPISGQFVLLPTGSIGESVQRTVLWPGGAGGNSSAPPPLVMPAPQPVLLDRFVTLAPQGTTTATHHHQEKRRSHDHSTTTLHGGSSGGLTVGLFPPQPPPQAPFLMMPFSHQNNSLLLSTQLTEHNLNTMVVTNHQLSESAVLNPMEVITSPVEGFAGGSFQQIPPSVVISHTETNSFVRSDINTVYPAQPVPAQQQAPAIQPAQIVIKEETEMAEETTDEGISEEETKTEVMDASNQTESLPEEIEVEEPVTVKEENETSVAAPEPEPISTQLPEPDMSGLNLLCCVASADEETAQPLIETPRPSPEVAESVADWNEERDNISSGLGLLCTAAERLLEEEQVVAIDCNGRGNEDLELAPTRDIDDRADDVENDLLEADQVSDDSLPSTANSSILPEKHLEWYAGNEKESDTELMQMKIKKKPGRPKKKSKLLKKQRTSRHEPPILQPWSASLENDKCPLGSPPTLTPHKRKLSNDESDEGSSSSSGHPPPLSPACSSSTIAKKRKVGRPKKSFDAPEKTLTISNNLAITDILKSNHLEHQQPSNSHNKIKPKLKAEAKVKDWCDDEELDLNPGKENELGDTLLSRSPVWTCPPKPKVKHLSPPRKPKVKVMDKFNIEVDSEVKISPKTAVKPPAKLPMKQTISPQIRNTSPQKHMNSPQRQTNSPSIQTNSLQKQTDPLLGRTTSQKQVNTLEDRAKSPQKQVNTSQDRAKSPQKQVNNSQDQAKSPQNQTKTSQIRNKSPQNQNKSPQRQNKSLQNQTKSPQSQTKSLQNRTKSPPTQTKSPIIPTKSLNQAKFPLNITESPPNLTQTPQRMTPPPVSHRTPSVKVATPNRTPLPKASSTPLQSPALQADVSSRPSCDASPSVPDCKITEQNLKMLPCRILTISDGQFYPGEVTKVILPGIYEVQIYKERCRKPQILCQEQVLTTAVSEVHCPENLFIPAGTRVCAYWSQQYSCFYPGRVVSDSASGQVPIDFDDGDNGTIERSSVRFLPQDYPTVEQPPNPLIGKRKRYNSTTSSDGLKTNVDVTDSELNSISNSVNGRKENVSLEEDRAENANFEERTLSDVNGRRSTSDSSSSDENCTSEAIRSVLEGFFRSEQEEKERQKRGERIRKRHKHHKHRDGSKVHKCKHSKHHRSHKHKRSRDDIARLSSTDTSKNGDVEKDCSAELVKQEENEEVDSFDKQTTDSNSTSKSKFNVVPQEKQEKWSWVGEGVRRGRALGPRGKGLKIFYKAIQRGNEIINTGDSAVFVSTGRPDRPFIGQIEQFWQCHMKKNMVVKIAWYYHPEETIGCPDKLPSPGGVFKSSHVDHNDVLTISHRCEVLSLSDFQKKADKTPGFIDSVYEINDTYYLAGFYDPSNITLTLDSEVSSKLEEEKKDTK